MMRICLTLLGALALGACGDGADDVPSARGDAVPAETPIMSEPDGGTGDGAVPPGEAPQTSARVIPARFHGVWDYTGGTCSPESDMRMEISGGEILFYESVGMVTASAPDNGDVVVTLEMEGEGETWVQAYRLTLSDGNQILNTQAIGEEFVGGPLPRKRCEQ